MAGQNAGPAVTHERRVVLNVVTQSGRLSEYQTKLSRSRQSSPDICRKCLRIIAVGKSGDSPKEKRFFARPRSRRAARTSNVICWASEGARWPFIVCINFAMTVAFRGRRTLSIAETMRLQCGRRAGYSRATCVKCGTSHALLVELTRCGKEHTLKGRLRNRKPRCRLSFRIGAP